MEYFKNINIEGLTGLFGVIIASIALGWNILNEIRKTPRAKIRVMIARKMIPGVQDDKDYLAITISNVGERPLKIRKIGYFGYKWWWYPSQKESFILVPERLPIYLKDGEEHTEMYPYTPEQFKELLDYNLQVLFAQDSADRLHRLSRISMLKFKHEIKKHVKHLK